MITGGSKDSLEELNADFFLEKIGGTNDLRDSSIRGRIILKMILRKQYMEKWTGLNYLRVASNDSLY